jgi:hypothetical protein
MTARQHPKIDQSILRSFGLTRGQGPYMTPTTPANSKTDRLYAEIVKRLVRTIPGKVFEREQRDDLGPDVGMDVVDN